MRALVMDLNKVKTKDLISLYETDIKSYTDYYTHLNCDLFDVVMVEWDGEEISIYVDDEGMLKSGNLGCDVEGYPQPLFGNLVFTGGVDEEGDTLPLPEKFTMQDIKRFVSKPSYITK